MTVQDIITSLGLPSSCRVDQRVPKKMLVENGAPTVSDKRLINEGIEDVQWLAALKPNTVGVTEYCDELREYLEIAVLSVTIRGDAKVGRLTELIHRAIPYPTVLLLISEQSLMLSLAHKRWAQNEAGKVVLDGEVVEVMLPSNEVSLTGIEMVFVHALALACQPQATLYALYQGWIDTLIALQAARITGQFATSTTTEKAANRRAVLHRCRDINSQIASLRLAASKEKQMVRQVAINLKIKALNTELLQAIANL